VKKQKALAKKPVVNSSDHGNEPSSSIKYSAFDQLKDQLLLNNNPLSQLSSLFKYV
jgi:hypothetical protein